MWRNGRRAWLRAKWRLSPCEFNSHHPHQHLSRYIYTYRDYFFISENNTLYLNDNVDYLKSNLQTTAIKSRNVFVS